MYTCILLNEADRNELKRLAYHWFNEIRDWQLYCHHLTLNMGPMDNELNSTELLGKEALIQIDAAGMTDKVCAVRATKMVTMDGTELKSKNEVPHITIAVDVHNGGKPVMSNDIDWWIPLTPKNFCGKLVENL